MLQVECDLYLVRQDTVSSAWELTMFAGTCQASGRGGDAGAGTCGIGLVGGGSGDGSGCGGGGGTGFGCGFGGCGSGIIVSFLHPLSSQRLSHRPQSRR